MYAHLCMFGFFAPLPQKKVWHKWWKWLIAFHRMVSFLSFSAEFNGSRGIWGTSIVSDFDRAVSLKPGKDCWQLLFAGTPSIRRKLIYFPDWFINFVFLQELDVLHEGVHVAHGGGERHRPVLQLQNEVLWEGWTKQKQKHQLPRDWGLHTAGSGARDCVVQGKMLSLQLKLKCCSHLSEE